MIEKTIGFPTTKAEVNKPDLIRMDIFACSAWLVKCKDGYRRHLKNDY